MKPLVRIQVFLLLRIARGLARCSPVMLDLLADFLVTFGRPFVRGERQRLAANVKEIFKLPPGSHFAVMFERQVFRSQILCAVESVREILTPGSLAVTGIEELRNHVAVAEAAGKGYLLVSAHLGSWELCAKYGSIVSREPLVVLAKPSRSPALTKFLDNLRMNMGIKKVLWTDRKSILRDMLAAVRSGAGVGFIMDQKPEGRSGPVVDFLGRPTEFVSGPAALAVKTGCGIIAMFCVRTGPRSYRMISRELFKPDHGESDEKRMTQVLAAEIERVVRLYPEQWAWSYKRWRFEESHGRLLDAEGRLA